MLWRAPAPAPIQPCSAPIPDGEALRKALLQASAQRGRRVARRRLAWRWLWWASVRFLLPAALVAGVGAWAWASGLLAPGQPRPPWVLRLGFAQQASSPPSPVARPAAPAPAPVPADAPPAVPPALFTPEGEPIIQPLELRLETAWAAAPDAPAGTPEPDGATPDIQPRLHPENWLHSKEP